MRKPYPNKSTSAGPPKKQGGHGGGPPQGKRCNSCKRWNHFSSVCYQKTAVEDLKVRDEGSGDEGEEAQKYFLGAVECPDSDPVWFVELDVNGNPVKWKLDSGADVSVMLQETFKKMRERPELKPILFVCGISLTSGQLVSELFPDCTRSCFSQVVWGPSYRRLLRSAGATEDLFVTIRSPHPGFPRGAVKPLGQFIAKTEFKGTKYSYRVIVVPKMIDCLMITPQRPPTK